MWHLRRRVGVFFLSQSLIDVGYTYSADLVAALSKSHERSGSNTVDIKRRLWL